MLERVGYDAVTAASVAAWAAADATAGRVLRVDQGVCTVLTEEGAHRVTFGGDLLRRVAADPTLAPRPGDWCVVRLWPDGPLTLERLLPRRSTVSRDGRDGRDGAEDVAPVAANVDLVAVVLDGADMRSGPRRRRRESCLTVVVTRVTAGAGGPNDPLTSRTVQLDLSTGAGLADLTGLLEGRLTLAVACATPSRLPPGGCRSGDLVEALVGARGLGTRRPGHELIVLPTGGAVVDVGAPPVPTGETDHVLRPGGS